MYLRFGDLQIDQATEYILSALQSTSLLSLVRSSSVTGFSHVTLTSVVLYDLRPPANVFKSHLMINAGTRRILCVKPQFKFSILSPSFSERHSSPSLHEINYIFPARVLLH